MSHSGRANCAIECKHERKSRSLYADNIEIIIRGDILIDPFAIAYIFDGYHAHLIKRKTYDGEVITMDLSKVFSIPREFSITYYDRWTNAGITIGFGIDRCVFGYMDQYDDDWCVIEYDGVTYNLNADSSYDLNSYEKKIKDGNVFTVDEVISRDIEYVLGEFSDL